MKRNNINFIIVNLITLSRLIGAFLLIPIYLKWGILKMALVLFFLLITDWLDGFLARYWHCSSFLGAFLDGMSDKVLGIIALGILVTINYWVVLNIIMEIIILLIGYNSAFKGNGAATNKIGKIKTFILSFSLIISYCLLDYNNVSNFIYNTFSWHLINLSLMQINLYLIILTILPFILEIWTAISYWQRDCQLTKKNKQYQTLMKQTHSYFAKLNLRIKMLQKAKENLKSFPELLFIVTDYNYYLEHHNDNLQDLILRRKNHE